MTIFCGCTRCEWHDRGKCSYVSGDIPACELELTAFDDMGEE